MQQVADPQAIRFDVGDIGWELGGITESGRGLVRPLAINVADGSSPDSGVLGPVLTRGSGYVHLAVSPDGQTFYASGLTSRTTPQAAGRTVEPGALIRMKVPRWQTARAACMI